MSSITNVSENNQIIPAGYVFLIEKYNLNVMHNWHKSYIGQSAKLYSTIEDGYEEAIYPNSFWPGEDNFDHLTFALKYDGINLGILAALFAKININEITKWIASKPLGKTNRRIWFLFEQLTGKILPLSNLNQGNYIELLDSNFYYTASSNLLVKRQRVINNLLGGMDFCPIVRRTMKMAAMENIDIRALCEKILVDYPPKLLQRAISYLYNKETKSSFQIEQIKPSASRIEKFIGLLTLAERKDFCNKSSLIDLQNKIVDSRFMESDYRNNQNYVGQTVSYQKELIHYISPKPEDLHNLMSGLIESHNIMKKANVSALVHSAVISYGFVFMHPFADGNGRIHRFLIHNIIAMQGLVPSGLMLPVSAAMLKDPMLYDLSLEAFSKQLLQLIEYNLDDLGQMSVIGETSQFYKYIDMTAQAEALCDFVILAVEKELTEELGFLAGYDKIREAIQEILDMPDSLIDLFIKICFQNNGKLSSKKREAYFNFLTDAEVTSMEKAFQSAYPHQE